MMKIHKMGSTAMLMRVCGAQFKPCCTKERKTHKALEVTEEIYHRKGIRYIVEHDAIPDENGMAEATFVNIGNYIVITDKGVRCLSKKDFEKKYSF